MVPTAAMSGGGGEGSTAWGSAEATAPPHLLHSVGASGSTNSQPLRLAHKVMAANGHAHALLWAVTSACTDCSCGLRREMGTMPSRAWRSHRTAHAWLVVSSQHHLGMHAGRAHSTNHLPSLSGHAVLSLTSHHISPLPSQSPHSLASHPAHTFSSNPHYSSPPIPHVPSPSMQPSSLVQPKPSPPKPYHPSSAPLPLLSPKTHYHLLKLSPLCRGCERQPSAVGTSPLSGGVESFAPRACVPRGGPRGSHLRTRGECTGSARQPAPFRRGGWRGEDMEGTTQCGRQWES